VPSRQQLRCSPHAYQYQNTNSMLAMFCLPYRNEIASRNAVLRLQCAGSSKALCRFNGSTPRQQTYTCTASLPSTLALAPQHNDQSIITWHASSAACVQQLQPLLAPCQVGQYIHGVAPVSWLGAFMGLLVGCQCVMLC
jgi:hypothetical protein